MENDELDRLVELADAAERGTVAWDRIRPWIELGLLPDHSAFIAACSPSVVSALVQRTRDAEESRDAWRGEAQRESNNSDTWHERMTAALARAEAAEELTSQWRERMWVGTHERMVWRHERDNHAGSEYPFEHCPICERNTYAERAHAAESALSGLVDRITQLADRWQARADDMKEPARGILLNHAEALRALTATSSPSETEDGR